MSLPADYLERVYAGVLGKIIGVYLGRPFEQWSHKDITAKLGDINYYVNDKLKQPVVVTDDDISGTFTFLRALEDNDYDPAISAAAIGRTWLNYIIKNRTILWWGGMGMSTEHTAFNRLMAGIEAPRSGSIELNGPVVAEQIGAQIFIDGWGLVNPGDPDRAAAMAKAAGSVSHDGEAVYGGQVVAVMVAGAFAEPDAGRLLDLALKYIPGNSIIARLIGDLRECRAKHDDWHKGLELIHQKYSYEKFGGGCHMVPNHAVVQLGLLWGGDNFQEALKIANTAGYDTDCNSGNVGCILGVRLGLAGVNAGPDWRGPVADRLILPTADGGSAVTDAVRETLKIARAGAALRGEKLPAIKDDARWNFALPGSVQGFSPETSVGAACSVSNQAGELAISFDHLAIGRPARVGTQVFFSPEEFARDGYAMHGSPTLYPGQKVSAKVRTTPETTGEVSVRIYGRRYTEKDQLTREYGPAVVVAPGSKADLIWLAPETGGYPYMDVGVEISLPEGSSQRVTGNVRVDRMDVTGTPSVTFKMPDPVREHWMTDTRMWFKQWVDGADNLGWGDARAGELLQLSHDVGVGLALTGTREWKDYRVTAGIDTHLCDRTLLCARVQGLRRYYAAALAISGGVRKLQIVKQRDGETVLAEAPCDWKYYTRNDLSIEVVGNRIIASALDVTIQARDTTMPLTSGGIAVGVSQGRIKVGPIQVTPTL